MIVYICICENECHWEHWPRAGLWHVAVSRLFGVAASWVSGASLADSTLGNGFNKSIMCHDPWLWTLSAHRSELCMCCFFLFFFLRNVGRKKKKHPRCWCRVLQPVKGSAIYPTTFSVPYSLLLLSIRASSWAYWSIVGAWMIVFTELVWFECWCR